MVNFLKERSTNTSGHVIYKKLGDSPYVYTGAVETTASAPTHVKHSHILPSGLINGGEECRNQFVPAPNAIERSPFHQGTDRLKPIDLGPIKTSFATMGNNATDNAMLNPNPFAVNYQPNFAWHPTSRQQGCRQQKTKEHKRQHHSRRRSRAERAFEISPSILTESERYEPPSLTSVPTLLPNDAAQSKSRDPRRLFFCSAPTTATNTTRTTTADDSSSYLNKIQNPRSKGGSHQGCHLPTYEHPKSEHLINTRASRDAYSANYSPASNLSTSVQKSSKKNKFGIAAIVIILIISMVIIGGSIMWQISRLTESIETSHSMPAPPIPRDTVHFHDRFVRHDVNGNAAGHQVVAALWSGQDELLVPIKPEPEATVQVDEKTKDDDHDAPSSSWWWPFPSPSVQDATNTKAEFFRWMTPQQDAPTLKGQPPSSPAVQAGIFVWGDDSAPSQDPTVKAKTKETKETKGATLRGQMVESVAMVERPAIKADDKMDVHR